MSCWRRRSKASFRLRGERSSRALSCSSAMASGLLAPASLRSSVVRLAARAPSERSRPFQAGLLCWRRCSSEAWRSSRARLAVGVVERLAQADSPRQGLAGLALLVEQALAAEQHVAVEERLGQPVVRVVRGTGALVDVLGDEIELQVAAHLGARPTMAEAVENGLLGLVQRHHHLAVLPCQGEALALHVELAQRFEQARLDPQVFAQLEIQAGKTLLHRLVGEQRVPQHREQPVPGRPGHQQQRFVPDIGDLAAALVHADHGVDREDQGRRGDRRIALAEGAEEDHAERRQRHPGNEQPGIGEQQLDGEGGDAEAQQGHQQRLQAA